MRTLNIIFDIDGTLANISHRLPHVLKKNKDHDTFYSLVKHDTPIKNTVDLAKELKKEGHNIIFVSGRRESSRKDTEKWLKKYVFRAPVYLRKTGDERKDFIVKKEILDELDRRGFYPDVVFEDRPTVIQMWKEEGIPVIDVGTWNEGDPDARRVLPKRVLRKQLKRIMAIEKDVEDIMAILEAEGETW